MTATDSPGQVKTMMTSHDPILPEPLIPHTAQVPPQVQFRVDANLGGTLFIKFHYKVGGTDQKSQQVKMKKKKKSLLRV